MVQTTGLSCRRSLYQSLCSSQLGLTVHRFLVRPEGELPGFSREPSGLQPRQIRGRQPAQGGVRVTLVIIPPPRLAAGIALLAVATENRIRAGADAAMGYPRFGMIDLLKLLGGLLVGVFRSQCGSRSRDGISPPATCCPAAVRRRGSGCALQIA